ncbi:MAG: 2-oxoacid:acceptor oxidoreductase subunit alpha [Betaproteobacteria bacterium]|nr:2-oxoacid:acceptor oxidoreductase subunit alpha [Betaproteobacteria bacterium]MDH5223131.1 2-oxoacid:acceptor oxidoreductase subunit alpha [Betaproteobacteria bacterium]MDH5351781.1 2-oxoacid:acceptor oxidoreductase subunit alpha [Betaproteobacteria bacterium]
MDALGSVSVALAGSGGAGVMTAGNMLLEAASHAGYYGLMTRTSGPQIRGGEAAAMLRISTFPGDGQDDAFHVLAAIDWQNVARFAAELPLAPASLILGDPAAGEPPEVFTKSGARYAPVPLKVTAAEIAGAWPNMVALGVLAGIIGLPAASLEAAARKAMKKGLEPGIAAAQRGYALAAQLPALRLAPPPARSDRWLITGNEAAGYGALRGGVRFVAAYPITPATELLEYLAPALAKVGGTLVQAEDELASINMALGASYGGVPSLTATSGPGLSLMIESLGLGVAAEVPVVVVDVMRTGPSTGIATKSEQADLGTALYGLHGDAPHVVVAPNSLEDCLAATEWAVGLAEALQVPAIVLSDQYLGQARGVVDAPALGSAAVARLTAQGGEGYRRYALTPAGVSPMAIPGTPGATYTADGLEHNERGTPSSQASDHAAQMDKRARKLAQLDPGEAWASVEGEGDTALVTFGSCTGPAREALARNGKGVKLVSLRLLAPAQPERLKKALAGVKRVLVLEQNHSGQFLRYLRAEYDLPGEVKSLRRPGPLPFRPAEIQHALAQWGSA